MLAADLITLEEVQDLAVEARAIWQAAGATDGQIQALEDLRYEVADLGDQHLASFSAGVITIDDNAAGNLWFVDSTPLLNEEFASQDGALVALDQTLAYAKTDLLTTLLHEQGHALGLEGVDGDNEDVLNETLAAGIRRLPLPGQADGAVPGSLETVQYLTSSTVGGGAPLNNLGPFGSVNYVVALQGLFPSRSVSSEPFLGSVELFAGTFAPRGFALAHGQLLQISQNTALFSVLGTTYGGDGETTFALPDLRGRVPIGAGQGPGLEGYQLGQTGGSESITLTESNLPSHTHTLGDGSAVTSAAGGDQPIDNRRPFLALTPVVATIGIFPSPNLSAEDFLGSVSWFAGNFAPLGYAIADGSLLQISQNTALFSLLGTTYGGDGETTFALPDLRGRMAIHQGTGPGLAPVELGQRGGSEFLSSNVLPSHTHEIPGTGIVTNPAGQGATFDNRSPFLALNYNVALVGFFPTQSLDAGDDDGGLGGEIGEGFVSGVDVLSEADALPLIEALVQEGIDRWRAAGLNDAQVAVLESATIELRDLPSGRLAALEAGVITIDRDASHRGWYLDATPSDDVEFADTDPRTGQPVGSTEASFGHYDLLTTIMHEQGHLLEIEHTFTPGELLYGALSIGTRINPSASEVALIDEDGDHHDEEPHGPEFLSANSAIASVGIFAGNFAPFGFAQADGQLLDIANNTALFSVVGTTYGGDGETTFGLPDYRGRAVVGAGQGPGLSDVTLGQLGGSESDVFTVNELPPHSHEVDTLDFEVPETNGPVTLRRDGDDLVVVDAQGNELSRQMLSETDVAIIQGGDTDDELVLDFTTGDPIPAGGLIFNGGLQNGTGGGDTITIIGSFTDQVFTHTPPGADGKAGTIALDGSGLITFTGLEPINAGNSVNTIINLPVGLANDATLQNSAVAGEIEIIDNGATFEDTVFPIPTGSLTVNLGDQGDTLLVNALDDGFAVPLTVNGGASTSDTLILNGVTLDTAGAGRGLDVTDTEMVNVLGSTISNNSTTGNGGGIRAAGTMVDLTITDSVIRGNTSSGNGGGIAISGGSTLDILRSTLSDNNSGGLGGGVFRDNSVATIVDSTISGNTSVADGGGVFGYAGSLSVANSTLSGNTANSFGGGIANGAAATIDITSSTITGNRSNANDVGSQAGGGIAFAPAVTAMLSNTIVAGNFLGSGVTANDIDASSGFQAASNNLIGDAGSAAGLIDGVDGNQVDADPLLGPLADNGGPTLTHTLLPGSPAINAGDSSLFPQNVTSDQRGLPRVMGGQVDIGAVESQVIPAQGLIVSTTTDVVDGDFAEGQLSLREAILIANEVAGADTITFDANLFAAPQTVNLTSQLPTITQTLTITGPGLDQLTIDGGGSSRIFLIDDNVTGVNLSGLTLTGGTTANITSGSDSGGAIRVEGGGELNLSNALLIDNQSIDDGGAISFASGSTGVIQRSTFTNNRAVEAPGVDLENNSGGAIINGGNLTIRNSTFNENRAEFGGAILTTGALSLLTIDSSTFSGNRAAEDGGAIRPSTDSTTTINNSTITGNRVEDDPDNGLGGGIALTSTATVTINHTIVSGNEVENAQNSSADNISQGGGTLSGGFNLLGDGDASGANDITGENSPGLGPLADNGGPTQTHALLPGSPAIDAGDSTLLPQDVTSDQRGLPRVAGGQVEIGAFERQVIPAQGLIVSTTTDVVDGDFAEGQLSLREAILIAGEVAGADTITFDASLSGAEIDLVLGELVITEALAIDASALADPITIDAQQNSRVLNFVATTGDLSLSHLTISGGRTQGANDDGGGIRFGSDGVLSVSDSTVSGNSTTGVFARGGGIFTFSGSVTLAGSTLSGNESAEYGGGIFTVSGSVTLTGSTVGSNRTTGQFANGGGIFTFSGSVTLTGSTVSGNSATGQFVRGGGGIYTNSGSVTLAGSTVSGNSTTAGGGIYTNSGSVTLTNSTVSGNSATGQFANGGGIFAFSGSVTLTSSTLSGNETAGSGGGVFVANSGDDPTFTVTGSIIAGNLQSVTAPGIGDPNDLVPDPESTLTINHSLIGVADNLVQTITGDVGNQTGTAAMPLDPQLGPLADNGGSTFTHALLPGSPAIDAGDRSALPQDLNTDQRGLPRVNDLSGIPNAIDGVDLGAFELFDTTVPVLSVPAEMTFQADTVGGAASSGQAVVDFLNLASATDDLNPAPIVSNNAPAVLPIGMTQITFTADDGNGNQSTAMVTVTVEDTTSPVVSAPTDIQVEADTTGGADATGAAIVAFLAAATASDIADDSVMITNDAPSVFPIGMTTVTFTGTDESQNVATATAVVTVVDATPTLDFGDAPAGFPVSIADDGARHVVGGLFLGAGVDAEADGVPSEGADSDGNDDDGVVIIAEPVAVADQDTTASFQIVASGAGLVNAWIDFNGDGDWNDPGEQIATDLAVVTGSNILSYTVPAGATAGQTAARFRLSTQAGLSPTGAAADGEVEDYLATILDGSSGPGVSGPGVLVDLVDPAATIVIENGQRIIRSGQTNLLATPITSVSALDIFAGAGNTVLTLDQSGGGVVPTGGLIFDGNGGPHQVRVLGGDFDLRAAAGISLSNVDTIQLDDPASQQINLDVDSLAALAASGVSIILGSSEDGLTVDDPTDLRLGPPSLEGENLIRTIVDVDIGAMIRFDLGPVLQNPLQNSDVDNNGMTTALDALVIINELAARQFSDPEGNVTAPALLTQLPDRYFDSTGDGRVSALDALFVINRLALAPPAEGEAINQAVALPPNPLAARSANLRSELGSSVEITTSINQRLPSTLNAFASETDGDPLAWDLETVTDQLVDRGQELPIDTIDESLSDISFLEGL